MEPPFLIDPLITSLDKLLKVLGKPVTQSLTTRLCTTRHSSFTAISLWKLQGGGTPIYPVRSSSLVQAINLQLVKGQVQFIIVCHD